MANNDYLPDGATRAAPSAIFCSVPFSDGLSLRSGAVSISDDQSEPVRVGSAAPWRSAMLLREAKVKSRCVPAFSCEQRATKAGHVSTRLHHDRDVGQQGHLGHRE